MLSVTILCVGGLKESYFRAACAEYEKRLTAYVKLHTKECASDEQLLASLRCVRGHKIALCVEGKQLSSESLAAHIDRVVTAGKSEVVFVIGGAEGLTEEAKALCDLRLSFSMMTFPHRLARLMLLEQIYRAETILRGTGYHK